MNGTLNTGHEQTCELCDHPKMPVRLMQAEARQALLDAALRRASLRGSVWPAVDVTPTDARGTDLGLHAGSLGLCVARNWAGVPLAVIVDALLTEMEIRALVEQTVAMLPRWAAEKLPGLWSSAPQSVGYTRTELNTFKRWGLIEHVEYDSLRKCMMWECTELLGLVVMEMEKEKTTEGTDKTEGETTR